MLILQLIVLGWSISRYTTYLFTVCCHANPHTEACRCGTLQEEGVFSLQPYGHFDAKPCSWHSCVPSIAAIFWHHCQPIICLWQQYGHAQRYWQWLAKWWWQSKCKFSTFNNGDSMSVISGSLISSQDKCQHNTSTSALYSLGAKMGKMNNMFENGFAQESKAHSHPDSSPLCRAKAAKSFQRLERGLTNGRRSQSWICLRLTWWQQTCS